MPHAGPDPVAMCTGSYSYCHVHSCPCYMQSLGAGRAALQSCRPAHTMHAASSISTHMFFRDVVEIGGEAMVLVGPRLPSGASSFWRSRGVAHGAAFRTCRHQHFAGIGGRHVLASLPGVRSLLSSVVSHSLSLLAIPTIAPDILVYSAMNIDAPCPTCIKTRGSRRSQRRCHRVAR
jgi:hypothetical protein